MKLKSISKTLPTPLPHEMNRVPSHLNSSNHEGQLPVDIFENDKEILIITPIAGVDPDSAEISITHDTLTIRGKRQIDLKVFNFDNSDAYLKECFWGEFSRSVILPTTVDIDSIEAIQRNHVLYIKVPKRSSIQMKIVKISSQ